MWRCSSSSPLRRSTRPRSNLNGLLALGGLPAIVILLGSPPQSSSTISCGKLEPRHDEIGIDAALESEARVGDDAELPPGARRALRIEIGRLDEDVGGGIRDAGLLAADHPAKPEHGAVVGDHAHVAVHLVALAVEREEPLALPAEPRADGAGELVGVIDVQRAGRGHRRCSW